MRRNLLGSVATAFGLVLALAFCSGCHYVPGEPPAVREISVAASIPPAYQANADYWNAVFQKQPGTTFGWSGGDAAISVLLPYCADCPPQQRHRRLWLFGDSTFSSVDDVGWRIRKDGVRGTDYAFGNVAALTSHPSANATTTHTVDFDYGAQGIASNAWMPLLADVARLPDLADLRVAAQGYEGMGFERTQAALALAYSLPTLVPEALRGDAVPVYEFYSRAHDASDYRLARAGQADGFEFQRIAFYVLRTPAPGTLALVRIALAQGHGIMLATRAAAPLSTSGSHDAGVLGYVYPATSLVDGAHPLVAYQRRNANTGSTHHLYTTRPNDRGKPVFMWPNRGVVIGNDLIQVYTPVTPLVLPGMVSWDEVEQNVVAIVRGVNRPYAQWGKTLRGNWVTEPRQYVLPHSDWQTAWGHLALKDADHARNGLLYVYGLRDRQLLVARLVCRSADDYVDFARWQFYGNGDWVASPAEATPIAADVSNDFSIVRMPSGRYLMVHANSMLAPKMSLRTAASPLGPFVAQASIDLATYVNERERARRYSYYAASVHESLSWGGDAGGVMISYVRSCAFSRDAACSGPQADDNRADVYVPRFINLPWHVFDAAGLR